MKSFVIDAGILIKLFFQEPYSDACEKLVKKAEKLIAPDLIWIEAGSVVRKRVRGGEISSEDAAAIMHDMHRVPIDTYSSFSLIRLALRIALETDRTVYDSLYVALAFERETTLLTADERLVNALNETPWATVVRFVGR